MKIRAVIFSFSLVFVLCSSPAAAQNTSPDVRETPVVQVVRRNAEAVVNISTEQIVLLRESPFWGSYGSEFDYLFDQFFGDRIRTHALKLKSVGSGVIVDEHGLVITNAHVVHMASSIFVILNDGTSVKGDLVYENIENDLALIRIKSPKPLRKVTLAADNDIIVGETAIAIGNPLGLENTVTVGIISGKERELYSSGGQKVATELLQTDAPINPGNSGGALLNLNGDLIGINVAVVQNSQSIGFAIPVKRVGEALEAYQLEQTAKPPRPQARDRRGFNPGMRRISPDFSQDQDLWSDAEAGWKETPQGYEMKFNIAGLARDKIDVEIAEGFIMIAGQGSGREEGTAPGGRYRSEQFHSFMRTFPIPDDADPSSVKTDFKADELIIRLSKKK